VGLSGVWITLDVCAVCGGRNSVLAQECVLLLRRQRDVDGDAK
jgi:hypothetical protein